METENKTKAKNIIIISIVLFIFIFILLWWFGGFESIGKFITYLILLGILITFVGFIAWVVFYLKFKEHKVDITWLNKQKLIQSALACKNNYLKDLYLSGDKSHAYVKLGKIYGYTQILCYKGKKLKKEDLLKENEENQQDILRMYAKGDVRETSEGYLQYYDKNEKKWKDIELPEKEDVFLIKNGNWLSNLFRDYMVIRVSPEDHTELVGDVGLKAVSLIKLSEYYYINKDYLDIKKIDYTILQEAKRGITFLAFADMHELVKTAMNLDSRFKKRMDEQGLLKEPTKPSIQQPAI